MKTLENFGEICAIQLRAMTSARVSEDLNRCRNCDECMRETCDLYIPLKNTELGYRQGKNAYILLG